MKRLTVVFFSIHILLFSLPFAKAGVTPSGLERGVYGKFNRTGLCLGSLSRPLDKTASMPQILDQYNLLRKSGKKLEFSNIDLKRFVNEDDWAKELARKHGIHPKRSYGPTAARSWVKGLRFINRNADGMPIDANLLKKIHQISFKRNPFHGFEGRRILKRYRDGEIDKAQFKKLLKDAYEKNIEVSGVSHDSLRGVFRSSPLDEIEHRGSSFSDKGERYFTKQEVRSIRANPYMKIDEKSLKKVGKNQYKGVSFFLETKDIKPRINSALAEANKKLRRITDPGEKIRTIIKLEKDLISIHPFLDGNGRSVRLLGDLIRQRHGLPPSLYPNERDLIMSKEEAFQFQRKGMIDYVNEWSSRLSGIQK